MYRKRSLAFHLWVTNCFRSKPLAAVHPSSWLSWLWPCGLPAEPGIRKLERKHESVVFPVLCCSVGNIQKANVVDVSFRHENLYAHFGQRKSLRLFLYVRVFFQMRTFATGALTCCVHVQLSLLQLQTKQLLHWKKLQLLARRLVRSRKEKKYRQIDAAWTRQI